MDSLHHILVLTLISSLQVYGVRADKCYGPEIPAFASITPKSDTYQTGDTVTYSCIDGGTLTGGDIRRSCASGGKWTGVAPLCLDAKNSKVCGIPPQASLTKPLMLSTNTKPGDEVQQECIDGYGPSFRSRCICMDTGRWDDHCQTSVSCLENPVPPTNLRFENYGDNCVRVDWDRPSSYNSKTKVEIRCPNSTTHGYTKWGGISTTTTAWTACSFAYYTSVRWDLRASEGHGRKSSVVSTPEIRLPCGEPSPPREITINTPSIVLESGRKRWKYTVSWQPPQYLGCDSLHKYPYNVRYPTETSLPTSLRTSSTVVYADGEKQIKFTVWARSNTSPPLLSDPTTRQFRTQVLLDIPAQPTLLQLTAVNSTCLRLSWTYTELNTSTGFQYRCLQSQWTATGLSSRSTTQCGFRPYQEVTCDVRTVNGKLYSDVTSSAATNTNCSAPSAPQNVQFSAPSKVIDSGRKRWMYSVSWNAPSTINCERLTEYDITFPNKSSIRMNFNTTSSVLYAEGDKQITFSISSRNNKDIVSPPTAVTIKTPILDFPASPSDIQLTATSATCVRLLWNYTEQSKITGFQHRCLETQWTDTSPSTRSATQCMFKPYQLVTCDVRAVNGVAYSNETSIAAVRTACAAPSPPGILVVGPPYYITKMRKWRYTVSWQAPTEINCAHLHQTPYIVRYPAASSPKVEINSTSLVLYEDWNEKIEFSVWSKNSDGLVSSPSSISMETPKHDAGAEKKTECPKVMTAIADPTTGRGLIEHNLLGAYHGISFQIGRHPISTELADGTNCSFMAIVYDYNLVRRLDFEARYPMECSQLNNSVTRQLIMTTLKQNYIHIRGLCHGVCSVRDTFYPPMACQNGTLTVRWPTTTTYKADVAKLPLDVESQLTKRLQNPSLTGMPVVIMTRVPPIVYPLRNSDGSSARVLLESLCKNNLLYNSKLDTCEK